MESDCRDILVQCFFLVNVSVPLHPILLNIPSNFLFAVVTTLSLLKDSISYTTNNTVWLVALSGRCGLVG